jgi:hypothetical protein
MTSANVIANLNFQPFTFPHFPKSDYKKLAIELMGVLTAQSVSIYNSTGMNNTTCPLCGEAYRYIFRAYRTDKNGERVYPLPPRRALKIRVCGCQA